MVPILSPCSAANTCKVGQAGHGAVVFHDLADHGSRGATGHGGQIATGFGVACAHQHAAVHGLQRENVAGLHQVFGLGQLEPRRLARCVRGRLPRCPW
jgi:hypothetical protein